MWGAKGLLAALMLALATAACAGTLAPAALAGEGCPNEAVRVQQGSTGLPDCRAYELVSASNDFLASVANSDDGSRVIYNKSSFSPNFYTATRDPLTGWQETSMEPAVGGFEGDQQPFAFTPDRSIVFVASIAGLPASLPVTSTLARLDSSGRQTVLATLPSTERAGTNLDMVVSDDGAHAFSNLQTSFDPEHLPDTIDVYDVAQDPPVLVSRLPDGSVPACGTNSGFASLAKGSTMVQHWVSRDGTKLFFLSQGSVDCSSPFVLYRRDMSSGTTVQVSGSGADATFLQASADGEAAVYETAEGLVPGDTNGHPDVYEWTATGGNECLTCVVADANVSPSGVGGAFDEAVGVSEDLSHVYFASPNVLASTDTDGTTSLYVWHTVNGARRIDYVSPILVTAGAATKLVNSPAQPGASTVTPNGNTFIFISNVAGLNAITGRSNGGTLQSYRYDDTTGGLSCVSCPASGPPMAGSVGSLAGGGIGQEGYSRVLSDDGHVFVFRTSEALVPQDVDNGPDLYEWHDGQVGLISDGVNPVPGTLNRASTLLRGISTSGNDIFISTFTRLIPDAPGGSMFVYDVRVDGGFAPPLSAVCSGEGCQGEPAGPPTLAEPTSFTFTGPGNVSAPVVKATSARKLAAALRVCRKRPKRHRKRCEAQVRRRFGKSASKSGGSK